MSIKVRHIVARILGFFCLLALGLVIAVQTPYVQKRISKLVINQLAAAMDGRIQYSGLQIMPSGALLVKDIVWLDTGASPADTLFSAGKITATFTLKTLLSRDGIHIGRLYGEDIYVNFVLEPSEYHSNFNRVFRKIYDPGKPVKWIPDGNLADISKLRIKSFRVRFTDLTEDRQHGGQRDYGIDRSAIDIRGGLAAHSVKAAGGRITGVLDRLRGEEKSGYVLSDARTAFDLGRDYIRLDGLRLRDPWSEANARTLSLHFASHKSFSHFLTDVRINADLERSTADMRTLAYLTGRFPDSRLSLDIRSGKFDGFVDDFSFSRIEFKERESGLCARAEGHITGLPDIGEALIDVKLQDLRFTTASADRLIAGLLPAGKRPGRKFAGYASGETFRLNLGIKGPVQRLAVSGDVSSRIGSAGLDADIRNITDRVRNPYVAAVISGRDVDVSRFISGSPVGKVSLQTSFKADLKRRDIPDITLDSLVISRLDAFDHTFRGLRLSAALTDGSIRAAASSTDSDLDFSLSAHADLRQKGGQSLYMLNGSISRVKFQSLGIKRFGQASASARIATNFIREDSLLNGRMRITELMFDNQSGSHDLGAVELLAHTTAEGEQTVALNSRWVDASVTGTKPITKIVSDLMDATVRRELPSLLGGVAQGSVSGRYEMGLNFHETSELLAIFAPGAYIADSTSMRANLGTDGLLDAMFESSRVAFGKNYLKNVSLTADNLDSSLNLQLSSSELKIGAFSMSRPALSAYARGDGFALGMQYDSFYTAGGTGEIYLNGEVYRDSLGVLVVKAHPLDSFLNTGNEYWTIDESDIVFRGGDFFFDRFRIACGRQSLVIDGGMSSERRDTLSISTNDIRLSLVNDFLPVKDLGISGLLNGSAAVISGPDTPLRLLMDFRADSLAVGGADAGTLSVSGIWADEGRQFDLIVRDMIDGRDAFYAYGSYYPDVNRLEASASFDSFPAAPAGGLFKTVLSEVGGSLSGGIRAEGPVDDIRLSSQSLRMQGLTARINMTGVKYTVNGPLLVDGGGVRFDGVTVEDDDYGVATLTGGVSHDRFRDFSLACDIGINGIKALDIAQYGLLPVYGLVRTSGTARISGPFTALAIDADLSNSGPCNIHVEAGGSLSVGSSDILTFTQKRQELDPYEKMLAAYEVRNRIPSDITVRANIGINQEVRAYLELDAETGNGASFSGAGGIGISFTSAKSQLSLSGGYTLSEGLYRFAIPGIVTKEFEIENGSNVNFLGDMRNTELEGKAIYGIKTSLSTLLASSSAVEARRQVNCGIGLSGRLSAPQVEFSIDVPDLDPTTRSQVESALNTADKVQKQFVALLLMGSFLPSESSGVFNGTNMIFSNMAGIVASEVSSILQKLDIPLDVGFNLQEGNGSSNIFDVAISTQLFNNRVIVGGSFGNRKYSSSGYSDEMAGDLDIQMKLDRPGNLRLSLFSHSADQYSSYLDYSQRNGVGISYQREYNRFGEFLRSLFRPRKRAYDSGTDGSGADSRNREQVRIKIGSDEEQGKALPDTLTVR